MKKILICLLISNKAITLRKKHQKIKDILVFRNQLLFQHNSKVNIIKIIILEFNLQTN